MRQLHLNLNWYGLQDWERVVARVLSLAWGVFWAWFGFASGAAEYASIADTILQTLPGLLFIGVSLFAWKSPAAGGAMLMALAFVVSAIVSFVVVKWLLRYVQTHTFTAFGWYRIAIAATTVALMATGTI